VKSTPTSRDTEGRDDASWQSRAARAPAFGPFVGLLARLPRERWPSVAEIDAAFASKAGVRFEEAAPRGRGRRARPITDYDARIADGVVATRRESLHDLMNALVWATFPRAKRRLHALQLDHLRASTDPGRRSTAHDTLAMLDEGGVLLAANGPVVFGHAILEHVACDDAPVFGMGVPVEASAKAPLDLDAALLGMLESAERFNSHRSFPRVRVGG
jgi:hypothetical protein